MPRTADPTADVEKAIKALDKAVEKAVAAQEKADAAYETQKRAERELKWYANHPDLPEDFDLDEFRRSLEAPFDDDDVDPIEPDEGEVAAVAEAESELDDVVDEGNNRLAPVDEDDDDDPFDDDED